MNDGSPVLRRIQVSVLVLLGSVLLAALAGCDKLKQPTVSSLTEPHAANVSSLAHHPRLAVILDDVGGDDSAVQEIFSLSNRITLSILPNHPRSVELAEEAHARGFEVMLHLPMESEANESPESEELRTGMSAAEVARMFGAMLGTVPHAAGVNNHQGSRATSDQRLMEILMPLLHERGLFFIDSRTTAATLAYLTDERDGVPSGFRNVPFLDDVQQQGAIRQELERAIHAAREKGEAIVIGHPHPDTLHVLRQMLPQLSASGIELVHASALVHASGNR